MNIFNKSISKKSTVLAICFILGSMFLGGFYFLNQPGEFAQSTSFTPDYQSLLQFKDFSFILTKIVGPNSFTTTSIYKSGKKSLEVKNYKLSYLIKNTSDKTLDLDKGEDIELRFFSEKGQINYHNKGNDNSISFNGQFLPPQQILADFANLELAENNDEKNIYLELRYKGEKQKLNLFSQFPGEVDINLDYEKVLPAVEPERSKDINQDIFIKTAGTEIRFKLVSCQKDVPPDTEKSYLGDKFMKCTVEIENIGEKDMPGYMDLEVFLQDNLHHLYEPDSSLSSTTNNLYVDAKKTIKTNLFFDNNKHPEATDFRLLVKTDEGEYFVVKI